MKWNLKRGAIAFFLSMLTPGLGHLYVRRPGVAILCFLYAPWAFLMLNFAANRSFRMFAAALLLGIGINLFVIAHATTTGLLQKRGADLPRGHTAVWAISFALAAMTLVGQGGEFYWKWLFPWQGFKTPSVSMSPTIKVGDRIFVKMDAFSISAPRRGDVVLTVAPGDEHPRVFKRVIAVGGDEIRGDDGRHVFVDRKLLNEPYLLPETFKTPADPIQDQVVPEGMVFLMGDNRENSYDSREYGPVSVRFILGRPVYIWWSPDHSRIGRGIK
jgi:signal peptidase I